ncbi:MAG: cadherin domain-containing protein, partial [Gammaproteobacteria bacterium]
LVVAGALDFEAAALHQVIVRATDSANNTFDKTFTIDVTDVNEAPTDIALSNGSVAENSANGVVVGALSAVDADAGDTASFTLLNDAGGLFALNGSDVVVAGPLDYETATSHQITVRATDSGGLTVDKVLTIDVTDVAGLTVVGDAGNNVLTGSPENDTIQALGGNDVLQGLAGDDTLDGGAGFDRAVYTDATGSISVDMAAGTVTGSGVGNDTLVSIESVQGGDFADNYVATSFNSGSNGSFNEFEGMAGDDTITGNGNTRVSYLHAGAAVTVDVAAGTGTGDASVGTDSFTGVSAVRGSMYDDTIEGSNNGFEQFEGRGGSDLIDGRGGLDRVRYEFESAAIQVDLASGVVTGGDAGGGQDTLRSIELVRGTNFDDTFDATGFGPSSTNAGSAGTYNEFEGMGGNDTITGNGNTNLVFYNATGGVTVDLAAGTVTGDASVGSDTITGGVNTVTGSQFDDTLEGFANPFGVANVFDGRAGNDTFDGRDGYDQAVYNNDGATHSGIVVDMATGTVTGDASIGTDTLISIESVRGTNFADTYDATGYTGASADLPLGADFSEFEGMGGDDVITGNGNTRISYLNASSGVTVDLAAGTADGDASVGHDTFIDVSRARGSNFDDTISGDGNNNVLEGRNGNDVLDGRGGNDTLTGGGNADTFVYATGGGADTITDFNQGESDQIDLSGVNGVTDFAGVLALASQSGADTVIDFGGGDTLTLTGVTLANLTANDFVFQAGPPTVTLTVAAGNGYDMHGLYGDLGYADGHATGATHDTTYYDMINAGTGHTIHLTGSGLTYDGSDSLTGGTINGIEIQGAANSPTYVTMTGFAIDAASYISAAAALSGSSNPVPFSSLFNQYAYDAHGSAGNDIMPSFANADTFDGGAGLNTVDYLHYGSGITVDLAVPSQNTGNAAGDSYVNITGVIGTNYDDVLIGDANANALEGGQGADSLTGGGGPLDFASYQHASAAVIANLADPSGNTGDAAGDTYSGINSLLGSNYDDTLTGDAGDNYLRGRGGADALDGGAGTDTADYNNGPAVRADLSNPGTNTGNAAGDSYVSIENLRGSGFDDTLIGDAGANGIAGQGGNDTINGGGGNDSLTGGGGADT